MVSDTQEIQAPAAAAEPVTSDIKSDVKAKPAPQPETKPEETKVEAAPAEKPGPDAKTDIPMDKGENKDLEGMRAELADMKRQRDKEAQDIRERNAQLALMQQAQQIRAEHDKHRADNRRRLESGLITEDEARERESILQERETLRMDILRGKQEAETLYRSMAIQKIAGQYNVESEALIKDTSLDSVDKVIAKAASMRDEAREKKIRELENEVRKLKAPKEKYEAPRQTSAGANDDDTFWREYAAGGHDSEEGRARADKIRIKKFGEF